MVPYSIQAAQVILSSGDGASELTVQNATKNILGPLMNVGNGQTAFKILVPGDIPSLSTDKLTSGVLPVQRGGTGLGTLGAAGQSIKVNAAGNALEYYDPAEGGTVSEVGLLLPTTIFTNGAPVTTEGNLTATLNNQAANSFFGGPTSGAAGVPAFRVLLPADIPGLDASKIVSGTLPFTRGGTGLNTLGGPLEMIRVNAAGNALEYFEPAEAPGTVTSVGLQLPTEVFTNGPDVTTAGDLTATLNAQAANSFLGGPTSGVPGTPAFRTLLPGDIPGLNASKITDGTLPVARGGTGLAVLGTPGQGLVVNAGGTALEYQTPGAPNLQAVLDAGNTADSNMALSSGEAQTKLEIQNFGVNGEARMELETFSGPGASAFLILNSDQSQLQVLGDSEANVSINATNTGTGTATLQLQGDGGNFIDHDVDLEIRDLSTGTPVLTNTIFANGEMSGAPGSAPDRFATVSQLPVVPATPNLQQVLDAGQTADSNMALSRASNVTFTVIASAGIATARVRGTTGIGLLTVESVSGVTNSLQASPTNSLLTLQAIPAGGGGFAGIKMDAENNYIQHNADLHFKISDAGENINTLFTNGEMKGTPGSAPDRFATVSQLPTTPTLQQVTTAGATTDQRVVVNGSNSNALGIFSITNTHATGGGLYVNSAGGVPLRVDGEGIPILQLNATNKTVSVGSMAGAKFTVEGNMRCDGAAGAVEIGDRTLGGYWSMVNDNRKLTISESGSTFAGINIAATATNMLMGIGAATPTSYVDINPLDATWAADQLRLRLPYTPTGGADANGEIGQIGWDDDYVYVKTSTGWKRSALTAF